MKHSAGRFEWAGSIAAPRLLVVSNNFHPGWRAVVNGAEVPVLRANHAFLAVPLTQAGPVRVTLQFHDPLTAKAHVLTLLGVLLMASCALLGTKQDGGGPTAPCSAPQNGQKMPHTASKAWSGAGALALRRALLWGLAGALVVGLLFALLRAVREPADSQRLVWFILAKALVCGLLAAPLAGRLLRQLTAPEEMGVEEPGPTAEQ